jgi:hypothetical protein
LRRAMIAQVQSGRATCSLYSVPGSMRPLFAGSSARSQLTRLRH